MRIIVDHLNKIIVYSIKFYNYFFENKLHNSHTDCFYINQTYVKIFKNSYYQTTIEKFQ